MIAGLPRRALAIAVVGAILIITVAVIGPDTLFGGGDEPTPVPTSTQPTDTPEELPAEDG